MKSQLGFTFMEMMVALLITAVLTASALPVLRHFYENTQDEAALGQLMDAIRLAKTTVTTLRKPVSLCLIENQAACSGGQGRGYLVFVDESADGVPKAREKIILMSQAQFRRASLRWRAFPFHRNHMLLLPYNLTHGDNGTFWYCREALAVWAVMISQSGRMRTSYPDADGIIKDAHGKPLSCEKTDN
ncbi:hypothetical protein AQUSIP_05720 [Aquicella siphonis]|uniref:Type II secretion system protein H n=1 Tax=Aquicella siphonis TaxID=254247 RepID=A0A5E4PEM5_9COXI|nr:GspH/FimT family pseudopilin [Aquicella siphonis]VVC75284.1 hypothetical protein AQUSIP_05720 [Aquicella siphonis]